MCGTQRTGHICSMLGHYQVCQLLGGEYSRRSSGMPAFLGLWLSFLLDKHEGDGAM
jgi:hypothetical protein